MSQHRPEEKLFIASAIHTLDFVKRILRKISYFSPKALNLAQMRVDEQTKLPTTVSPTPCCPCSTWGKTQEHIKVIQLLRMAKTQIIQYLTTALILDFLGNLDPCTYMRSLEPHQKMDSTGQYKNPHLQIVLGLNLTLKTET